ncbi:hypothetical protein EDB19DRAFT_1945222 [Suillus lakei]|nr:hypothetical protein EDB19DRAFT_1945222 [Suillus lakei]
MEVGIKFWVVFRPKDRHDDCMHIQQIALKLGNFIEYEAWIAAHCDAGVITLLPGDTLIIPPGQLHAVYTPVASFATGGHFYHYGCMHLTEMSRYLGVVAGNCLTNQMLHNALETLRRMMIVIPRLSPRIQLFRRSLFALCIMVTQGMQYHAKGGSTTAAADTETAQLSIKIAGAISTSLGVNKRKTGPVFLYEVRDDVILHHGPCFACTSLHRRDNSQMEPTYGELLSSLANNNRNEPRMSATETEKELCALVEDSVTTGDDIEIDMEEAIVEGFQYGFTRLLHQILGGAWMLDKETGKKGGGILANDMGPLRQSSMVVTNNLTKRMVGPLRPCKSNSPGNLVCQVALVSQWASEIAKMVVVLRVIEHHGQSRTTDPLKLNAAHIVVTSYSIVASEYATFAPPTKDESNSKKAASQSNSDSDSGEVVTKKQPGREKGKMHYAA